MLDLVDKNKRAFFGAKLSGLLEAKGIKQKEFASLIGASKNTVGDWVNGKRFPHPAQMEKICDALGVTEDVFSPFAWWERERIENQISEAQSAELERYARKIGLSEKFFEYAIQQDDFIREFPFHGEYHQNPLLDKQAGEVDFPLLKYQFEDDFGHRFMMVKEDLDFLKAVQKKSWKETIIWMVYEKRKLREKWITKRIETSCVNPDIDQAEVHKRVTLFDITRDNIPITEKDIVKAAGDVAREAGISPVQVSKKDIVRMIPEYSDEEIMNAERLNLHREPTPEEFKKAKAEAALYRIEQIQKMVDYYRRKGWLIEDNEEQRKEVNPDE